MCVYMYICECTYNLYMCVYIYLFIYIKISQKDVDYIVESLVLFVVENLE